MSQSESEKTKVEFAAVVSGNIRKRTRERISSLLMELLASQDVLIAAGLQVDIRELIRSTAVEEINEQLKEG